MSAGAGAADAAPVDGPLRLGTRGSALAVAQSTAVAERLEQLGTPVELVRIATSGDEGSPAPATADKARFVSELEQALLAGRIDVAVHSAKDLPGELPDGLVIAGVPARADARDALCLAPRHAGARSLAELPDGAAVGTASLRRRAQLLAARPDLDVRPLRGNVDTRLRRLAEGELDAAVLACAGLDRLGRAAEGTPIEETVLVPAAGQGCLALETRADDRRARDIAARLTDADARQALDCERALVSGIAADCDTPVGAFATLDAGRIRMRTFVGSADGGSWIRDELSGPAREARALGAEAARRLLAAGAAEILAGAHPS